VTRFCVKAEKRLKQYIKQEKSTFAEKISNFSMDQFSPYYGKKYFFPSKTSLDRLKLIYKTKKKWEKNNFVKAQTTAMWMGEEH
jgi:hypothetical protein